MRCDTHWGNSHHSKANPTETGPLGKGCGVGESTVKLQTSALKALILLAWPAASSAQVQQQPPPPPERQAAGEPAKQEPIFDPYRAHKSLEIGMFYMKKGNYDAAIERFEDAARSKPNFAQPYRLLGEAYEKKGAKAEAVKAYKKYLEILPAAEDAGKVRKRIAQLNRELQRAAARRR